MNLINQHKPVFLLLILLAAGLLRIINLEASPPSPYWEEVALGYDAYSIRQTLRDHHGNFLPIVAFESFGDWKPSLYFYAIVPFLYLYELSTWVVRLPSVISGIMIVLGVYNLAKEFRINPYLAAMLTAISPWAIMFSRAAWEVNLATALIVWGMVFGIRGLLSVSKINIRHLFIGIILLGISAYAYHAARIIAPLLIAGLFTNHFLITNINPIKYITRFYKVILLSGLVLLLLISPILAGLSQPEISTRFDQTSIFTDIQIIESSNLAKDLNDNSVLSRIIYHRYLLFAREILINFLSHFSLDFLFISGDNNPRHSTQFIGHLYYIELPLLLAGVFSLFRRFKKKHLIFFIWLVVGILPSSITTGSPHALRILPVMPIFILIISMGISYILKDISQPSKKLRWGLITFLIICYTTLFTQFWHHYQYVYPKVYAQHWQYGYEEMIDWIDNYRLEQPQSNIYITREQGRPSMYYFFYTKTDPRKVQQQSQFAPKDQSEILQFENIHFIDNVSSVSSGSIVVSSPDIANRLTETRVVDFLKSVYDDSGNEIWVIYSVE